MNRSARDFAVTVAGRVRAWASDRRYRIVLVARFAPVTVRALVALSRVAVAERLWRVPPTMRPDIATRGTSP